MANKNLHSAKREKNDEFYTQLVDIEKELRHYKEHFKDKTVYCNCDDPFQSNFFKYFAMNFNHLGLKKLISTAYIENGQAYKIELTGISDVNDDGAVDLEDVEQVLREDKTILTFLEGDGDFRSEESIELLKEADIIVTNPPFSLFREYVAQLVEYDKKFLILGNLNAIAYKEIFPLLKNNMLWMGISITSGDREFRIPEYYETNSPSLRIDKKGIKYVRVSGVRWYTNLEHYKRNEKIVLYKKYTPEEYPKYSNYNAINVDKVADIPYDYEGVMGVPITIMQKYNPEQFEIIDINPHFFSLVEQGLEKPKQLKITGHKDPYARILIKRKGV